MPYRNRDLRCPDCQLSLRSMEERGTIFSRCPKCQGLWFESAAFWSLFREAQPDVEQTELMIHNDGTPRRPCPECGQDMDIGWINLLQLDQCEQHGIWFDRGELERALDHDVGQEILHRFVRR